MTAAEINAARRSLSAFRGEFERFTGWAGNAGKAAAKSFGKNFKSIAVFTIRELARGALPAIGAKIVENWGKTGHKTGKAFGSRAKKAAAAEMATFSSKMGGGAKWNLGTLPIVGAAALAALAASQIKSAFETAFEQERITISLDALSVDGGGGSRIFDQLRKDALRTGIEVSTQAGIVQKMMAQGIDESGALALNRSMLDIAGGTGLTTNEVELLGTALAQIKGKGVAAMEELRGQIAEKGVPIFEALRQKFGADDIADVFKDIAKGKVTADDVLETFKNLEGPFARFLGASDRLGQTGGGLVSRLKEEATDLQRVFMADVMPSLKPALEYGISLIQKMKDGAKEFGKELANAIGYVQAAFESLSLQELLQLAGLALKRELIEALDTGARGIAALMAAMEGGNFGAMLERSALRFKEVMLSAISEILRSLEEALPEGGRMALAVGAAANQTEIRGNIAGADRQIIEGKMGTNAELWAKIQEEFKKAPQMFGFSATDAAKMDSLLGRITSQRDANIAGRSPDAPIVAPAGSGGGGSKSPFDATGMVAGGLANAISRITGGGDILMTKSIESQEGTRKAAEATAKAAEATAKGVEKLVTNTTPRRGGRSTQAQLVL